MKKKIRCFVLLLITMMISFSCKERAVVELTPGMLGNVSLIATSCLDQGHYEPKKAFDGNAMTAWVEGKSDTGIGESLTLSFKEAVKLKRIGIHNGYDVFTQTGDLFYLNSRIKKAKIEFDNGAFYTMDFDDNAGTNYEHRVKYLDLPQSVKTSSIKITILDTFPGSKWQDTSISEIELYGYAPENTRIANSQTTGTNLSAINNNQAADGDNFFGSETIFDAAKADDKSYIEVYSRQVNQRGNNGITPLMTAAKYGSLKAIKSLISSRADIDAGDNQGSTAFMYAAQYNQVEAMKLLARSGANLTVKDDQGWNALFYCARFSTLDAMEYLLSLRILGVFPVFNINAKDKTGATPAAIAFLFSNGRALDRLEKAGAKLK